MSVGCQSWQKRSPASYFMIPAFGRWLAASARSGLTCPPCRLCCPLFFPPSPAGSPERLLLPRRLHGTVLAAASAVRVPAAAVRIRLAALRPGRKVRCCFPIVLPGSGGGTGAVRKAQGCAAAIAQRAAGGWLHPVGAAPAVQGGGPHAGASYCLCILPMYCLCTACVLLRVCSMSCACCMCVHIVCAAVCCLNEAVSVQASAISLNKTPIHTFIPAPTAPNGLRPPDRLPCSASVPTPPCWQARRARKRSAPTTGCARWMAVLFSG